MKLHPVIMAGGSGTRLWPMSREFHPKPFMSVSDGGSLLQDTVARLDGIPNAEPPVIVCNEEHRFLAAEHTRRIGRLPKSILLEPEGRNTAPTLTLAALALAADAADGEDPLMLVLPADHAIGDNGEFRAAVDSAARLGAAGFIVTFGVAPDAPSTAYGYIRKGAPLAETAEIGAGEAYEVARFVEKPDAETARRMLDTGEYLWNSGMFVLRASAWLEELARFRPDIAESCRRAYAKGAWDGMFYRPDAELFLSCPPDTIDYAVMERIGGADGDNDGGGRHHHRAAVAPLYAGWSDVGSWAAIMDAVGRDADGNVVRGDVYTHETRNSMVFGQHRLVAAVGLEDVIVVETPDAVLAASRERVEEVRAIVERLKEEGRHERENHRREHRPWGWFDVIDAGPRFQVKRITVNPGQALSLQMHHHRSEHWVVVSGVARVVKDDKSFLLRENQSTYVKQGEKHRLENPGAIPLEIIEVQSGSYLGEDDIVRFEDMYNR